MLFDVKNWNAWTVMWAFVRGSSDVWRFVMRWSVAQWSVLQREWCGENLLHTSLSYFLLLLSFRDLYSRMIHFLYKSLLCHTWLYRSHFGRLCKYVWWFCWVLRRCASVRAWVCVCVSTPVPRDTNLLFSILFCWARFCTDAGECGVIVGPHSMKLPQSRDTESDQLGVPAWISVM